MQVDSFDRRDKILISLSNEEEKMIFTGRPLESSRPWAFISCLFHAALGLPSVPTAQAHSVSFPSYPSFFGHVGGTLDKGIRVTSGQLGLPTKGYTVPLTPFDALWVDLP